MTGEVPPKGAEGEGRSQSGRRCQVMTFQKSSVRLPPSGPTGHLPRKTGEASEIASPTSPSSRHRVFVAAQPETLVAFRGDGVAMPLVTVVAADIRHEHA